MSSTLLNPTVIVPGLNRPGTYDESEGLLTLLSDWLEKNSPAGSDQRLHIHERGMLCYHIFFLDKGLIEAMFTLSIYFDPWARARDPNKALWRSGLVVEVVWSDKTSLLPFMFEVLAAVGYHLELGFITLPAATPVQQRLLGSVGFRPYSTGIQLSDGTTTSEFRLDLHSVGADIQSLSRELHLA
ncbi:MAG: hypothetical protein ACEQSB_01095 [Undibacterium sp.]